MPVASGTNWRGDCGIEDHRVMRRTVVSFDPSWGELVDVDVLDENEWFGLFRHGHTLTLRTPRAECTVPADLEDPIVRALDLERAVIVDPRTTPGRSNGWIVALRDGRSSSFFAGEGIQDVLANRESIVVTYFDEGVFRGIEPGHEGVAVFEADGRYRGGYQTKLGVNAVDVSDCYAACWVDDTRIVFLPYTDFPVVTLDVMSFEQHVVAAPRNMDFAHAISATPDGRLLFALAGPRGRIVRWSGGPGITDLDTHVGPIRGLLRGRFLARGAHDFTILDSMPE